MSLGGSGEEERNKGGRDVTTPFADVAAGAGAGVDAGVDADADADVGADDGDDVRHSLF